MNPLLLFLLFHFSLASRNHGRSKAPPIVKRPEQVHQGTQDDQIVRLPMTRRPPSLATRAGHHGTPSRFYTRTSSTSSAGPTATTVNTTLVPFFQDTAYGVKLWIGEPEPQLVTLDFDTGSSETWVSPPCSGWVGSPESEELCRALGTYIPEQSSSAINNSEKCPAHWVLYGSGSVFISYYKDYIRFQDPYLEDFSFEPSPPSLEKPVQFGFAIASQNMPSGIFGAGYGAGYNQDYYTIIDEMHRQGMIQDKDFSIALGDINDAGEVIFGGIDLAKFAGPLHELEISSQVSKEFDGYYRYWVNVTAIGITAPGSCLTVPLTSRSFEERFLPDTGTTLTYIPEDAFFALLNYFPDAEESWGFGYIVNCSVRDLPGTIDFTFHDFTIHVPYSDFIFSFPPTESSGPDEICSLGAVPTSDVFILGDTFLRAVYAVFRQQEHKVYFAKYKNCGTNIISSHAGMRNVYGDCPEEVDGHDHDARHYGFPPSASATRCTSISTGSYPPEPSTQSDPWEISTFLANTKFPRPAVPTGNPSDPSNLRSPFETVTTSVESILGAKTPSAMPPWKGNVTAVTNGTIVSGASTSFGSTGIPPSPTNMSSISSAAQSNETTAAQTSVFTFTDTKPPMTFPTTTLSGSTETIIDTETDLFPTSTAASSTSDCSTSSLNDITSVSWITDTWEPSSFVWDTSTSAEFSSWSSSIDTAFTDEPSTTSTQHYHTTVETSMEWSPSSFPGFSSLSTWWITDTSSWDAEPTFSSSSEYLTTSSSKKATTTRHHTTTTSETPEISPVVTIPVEPDETIVVKLESTTYTIVDGSTLPPDDSSTSQDDGLISTLKSYLSSISKEYATVTDTETWTWSTESDTEDFSSWDFTTFISVTPTSTTTATSKTRTTSARTKSTFKTVSTLSSSSSSSTTDDSGGYITSWYWNPTSTGSYDPFITESDTDTETYEESYHQTNPTTAFSGAESTLTLMTRTMPGTPELVEKKDTNMGKGDNVILDGPIPTDW